MKTLKQTIVSLTLPATLVAGLTLSSCSCASKDDLAQVRSEAQDAKRIAEEASETAQEAHELAQDADARSRKTEEAVNRGFKKSMYK